MKKIIALVLALAMVAVLGLAFADPTNTTITVKSGDTHEYSVYQIFTGELSEGVLSNVHWGKNGTGTKDALVEKATLDTIAAISGTDAEKAAALEDYANLSSEAFGTVKAGETLTAPTGYYLIKDKAAVASGDTATLYIVQVVGPTEISRKASGTPTPDKTVTEKNDSTNTTTAEQETADYDIGDDVPFHVAATLPTTGMEYYSKYKMVLEDTLEDGKFDAISALTIAGAITETEDYTVTVNEGTPTEAGFKVTVTYTAKEGKTLASLEGTSVTIDYTAKLGANARIGGEGNSNTFVVKYSNNPNDDQSGEPTESTPEEKVVTFTYKVLVDKVDEKGDPLTGAGFTLYKIASDLAAPTGADAADAAAKNAYYAANAIQAYANTGTDPNFAFPGVDAGTFVLCETKTPAGYNTCDPIKFTMTAETTKTEITSLSGTGDVTFTSDTVAGSIETSVENNKGTVLPSTGGIGTTIFYILGGLLVVGAAVILVARRKAQD